MTIQGNAWTGFALNTGPGTGIGRATAKAVAADGSKVVDVELNNPAWVEEGSFNGARSTLCLGVFVVKLACNDAARTQPVTQCC